MADRYTERATKIDTFLIDALSADYRVTNLIDIQTGTSPTKYSFVTAFLGFINSPSESDTQFYADRQSFIIIGKTATLATINKIGELNIMMDDIVTALRGDLGHPPFGIDRLTLFRIENANIIESAKNDLHIRIVISGLIDEEY